MMDSRLQRIINDTTKLDRMRYREAQKTEQHRQLMLLKTAPLPVVKPLMTRFKDSKCIKCDVDLRKFTKQDDWYMEPIDALTMKICTKSFVKGWFNRIKLNSLRKILSNSMTSLVIHPAQIKMMKTIQKNHPEIPLVFVLNNKTSQLDLLLIKFVLYANDIKLPLTAVDEKKLEDSPIIGWMLKEMDFVCLNGAELEAKRNVLMMLDDRDEKDLQKVLSSSSDAFFMPVSINSETIQTDYKFKLFNNENNLGIIKINFHEPYTGEDFTKARSSLIKQQQADKAMTISKHLHYDNSMKRPIMSTNVVAFLLMTEFRDGASVSDLAIKLDALRKNNYSIDFAFEGCAVDIVQHAIDILYENYLEIEGNFIKPKATKMIQLSKYAEVFFPHFALQSILIISAESLKRSEGFIDFTALITTASDLCELLQYEIKFLKPCEDLVQQLNGAYDICSLKGYMSKPVTPQLTFNEQRAHRLARQFENEGTPSDDSDDGYQSRNASNEVTINDEMSKEMDALKNVTMPIIDAYLTVAYCLKKFLHVEKFTEQEFIKKSVKMMREEVEDGNCMYKESCSEAWVASALKCLQLSGMIEVKEADGHNFMKIHSDFKNLKSIKILIKRINRFM